MAEEQYKLREIGNVLQLGPSVDPGFRITNSIRSKLHVCDIVPLDYQLNLQALQQNKFAISYNFIEAIAEFKSTCKLYGLEPDFSGVRLWMTDDTSISEAITNDYGDNAIQQMINSMSGMGQQLRGFVKATGTSMEKMLANTTSGGALVAGYNADKAAKAAGASTEQSAAVGSVATGLAKTAASLIIEGKAVSLPKIWKSSSYSPTVSFNIRLASPYGSPAAIEEFILKPLLYLLILAAPKSNDGLSYGLPASVHVKAYGLTNINLACIHGINILRGGGSTSYNKYKQPLTVDLNLTVSPLTDGFAAMNDEKKPDMILYAKGTQYQDKVDIKTEWVTSCPAITTIGNIIQSFAPAPMDIVMKYSDMGGGGGVGGLMGAVGGAISSLSGGLIGAGGQTGALGGGASAIGAATTSFADPTSAAVKEAGSSLPSITESNLMD